MILNSFKPLILSGPSGCGKTTLISYLLNKYPSNFELSVSHTTRPQRASEKEGYHYYFVAKEIFESMIKNEEFLEFEEVHQKFYGTSKKEILRIAAKSKIPILDIDIKGALNIHKNCKIFQANYMFITTKEIESLRERLMGRGTESEETIKIRVNNAKKEIETAKLSNVYREEDYIYNENLEEAKRNFIMKVKNLYNQIN